MPRRPPPKARRYTVIVVGDDSHPVRRFVVSGRGLRATLRATVVALVLLAAGLAVAGSHVASLTRERGRGRQAEQENAWLRGQLETVREKIAHISGTLDRVELQDARLRSTMTNLQAPDDKASGEPERGRDARRGAPTGPTGALTPPAPARDERTPPGGEVMPAALAALEFEVSRQESALQEVQAYFDGQRTLLASSPSDWPTRGWVTSDFGARLDPYTASRAMHRGLDIATPQGQSIYAPSNGTVVVAGTETGYGKVIELDHGQGLRTRFAHLSEIGVKRGDRVSRGARLGAVGNTGRSTGPHLHYEVRTNGVPDNPRKFMLE